MDQEGLWVREALRGDQQAFARLVNTYQKPVYNLCYRLLGNAPEAEDAAQETFVRVYTHLKAYDPQQKLSSWVLAVASHHCIDRLRRRRLKWISLDQVVPSQPILDDRPRPEDTLLERESCVEVRNLLQSLPADYRLILVLRYWQDLSYEEMAQVVGTTESAIKSKLHRARQMLAQQATAQRRLEVRSERKASEGKKVTNRALL